MTHIASFDFVKCEISLKKAILIPAVQLFSWYLHTKHLHAKQSI